MLIKLIVVIISYYNVHVYIKSPCYTHTPMRVYTHTIFICQEKKKNVRLASSLGSSLLNDVLFFSLVSLSGSFGTSSSSTALHTLPYSESD